jgi:hypothetical protein
MDAIGVKTLSDTGRAGGVSSEPLHNRDIRAALWFVRRVHELLCELEELERCGWKSEGEAEKEREAWEAQRSEEREKARKMGYGYEGYGGYGNGTTASTCSSDGSCGSGDDNDQRVAIKGDANRNIKSSSSSRSSNRPLTSDGAVSVGQFGFPSDGGKPLCAFESMDDALPVWVVQERAAEALAAMEAAEAARQEAEEREEEGRKDGEEGGDEEEEEEDGENWEERRVRMAREREEERAAAAAAQAAAKAEEDAAAEEAKRQARLSGEGTMGFYLAGMRRMRRKKEQARYGL